MTIDEEIAWWTKHAFKSNSDAALIAFGVASGLKLAKADYMEGVANETKYNTDCNAGGIVAGNGTG